MKILRAVNRRGARSGSAGYFTVLLQDRWFAASRLPRLPYLMGQTHRPSEPAAENPASLDHLRKSIPWRLSGLLPTDRSLLRLVLAILGALALTSILLLWIMHPA